MHTTVIELCTRSTQTTDVTRLVSGTLGDLGADEDRLVHLFLLHATARLALLKTGAGSDANLDDYLNDLFPRDDWWRHSHGIPGHGANHVLPAIISPSLVVPVLDGDLTLGTWQSIVVVDTNVDNLDRTLRVSFLSG